MSSKQQYKRRQFFVDRDVQGALLREGLCYWVLITAAFGLVVLCTRLGPAWISGNDVSFRRIWDHIGPYLIASAVLIPIIVVRSIRFSNRFAGPMVRVRRTLKALGDGEPVDELKFREQDFWKDVAVEINRVAVRVARSCDCQPGTREKDEPVGCGSSDQ